MARSTSIVAGGSSHAATVGPTGSPVEVDPLEVDPADELAPFETVDSVAPAVVVASGPSSGAPLALAWSVDAEPPDAAAPPP